MTNHQMLDKKRDKVLSVMHLFNTYLFYMDKSCVHNFFIFSGVWNMKDKKFYRGATINSWGVLVYGRPRRFQQNQIDNFKNNFMEAA